MAESFNYGKAHAEAERVSKGRASTLDHAALAVMSDDELHAEHARSNSATRSELIRRELTKRGL